MEKRWVSSSTAGFTSAKTASRAWAWSARRVSRVRVFSRGPARPTPMRAVVRFIIRARASGSSGWSTRGWARQAGEVMSSNSFSLAGSEGGSGWLGSSTLPVR